MALPMAFPSPRIFREQPDMLVAPSIDVLTTTKANFDLIVKSPRPNLLQRRHPLAFFLDLGSKFRLERRGALR